jgi:nucleoid-associated protein YgaU
MVDRGMKVMLAMSVLLSGTAGALLFRRTPPQPGTARVAAPPLLLRERGAAGELADLSRQTPGDPFDEPPAARPESVSRPPSVLAPLDPGAPPPIMAKSYPRSPATPNSRWGTSMALGPPDAAGPEPQPLTHKIVDGDTLKDLAERYLGRGERSVEIYEANRYLLPGPDVLPIGVELKIPQPGRPEAAASDSASRGPLVPIPPGALRHYRRP